MQNSSKYSSILLQEAAQFDINLVKYFDELGNRKEVKAQVRRIVKKEDNKEFVQLDNGMEIFIDHIHSVDGEISPLYGSDFYACDCV